MAIKSSFTVPAGFDVAGTSISPVKNVSSIKLDAPVAIQAYCRVEKLIEQKTSASFDVGYYDADVKKRIASKSFMFTPDMTDGAKNYRAQAYEHLKTLPEFSGAIDC